MSSLLSASEPAAAPLSFQRIEIDAQPPPSPYVKLAGDFNSDGKLDILGANHSGSYQPVELWLNRPGQSNADVHGQRP